MSVHAAITGDIDLLKLAVLHDPLVGAICTPEEVWQMVDEMLVAQAAMAAAIRRRHPRRQGAARQGDREDHATGRARRAAKCARSKQLRAEKAARSVDRGAEKAQPPADRQLRIARTRRNRVRHEEEAGPIAAGRRNRERTR